MESEEMRYLFVPVSGNEKSFAGMGTGPVSQQQHAAREYHRKARLQLARAVSNLPTTEKKERRNKETDKLRFSICDRAVSKYVAVDALGGGRIDPFNAYCEGKPTLDVHEMLDHALSYQWSVFRFSSDPEGLNALKAEVMGCAMNQPLAWFTVIFAGATHNAFNYGIGCSPKFNNMLRLTYKDKAIRCLIDDISKSDGVASDGMLLSMVTLAAHGNGEVPPRVSLKRSWTTSSLSTAHNVDYYGGMGTAWAHMNALQTLVARRGGLDRVKLRAAAIAIQLYDVFTSWRLFRPPLFPLLQPTSYFVSLRSHQADTTAAALTRQMASGFSVLPCSAKNLLSQRLLQLVDFTATLSVDLHQWERKTVDGPDYVHIQFTRWCILHDLLSLPELSENPNGNEADVSYEMIRLSTFAYFLFTLVPVPHPGSLPQKIAEMLQTALDICIASDLSIKQPGLFLWSVMLGGMCAYVAHEPEFLGESASPLLNHYVEYTKHLSVKPSIHAWPLVTSLLGKYLWLDLECNELGETFWRHACEQVG